METHIKQSYVLISWQKEIEQQCDGEIWSEQKLSHSWNLWSHTLLASMLCCFSRVPLFVTLWPVSRQAPLTMGFSRQEYWNGLPCPPPGESSPLRDGICISCVSWISTRILYHLRLGFNGSPSASTLTSVSIPNAWSGLDRKWKFVIC